MSLASIQTLVDDKLRSAALGTDLAPAAARDRAIAQAVLQYDADAPRVLTVDVASVTGTSFAVPGTWVPGRSLLYSVESPVGRNPPALVDAAVGRDATAAWVIVLADGLAGFNNALVRVSFTAPHQLDSGTSTIPLQHEPALACWAAAEMCRQVATLKGHDRDASIQAAATSGQTQSGDLARRAREWLAQYRAGLGLPDADAGTAGKAAGEMVQWRREHLRGRFSTLTGY